MAATKLLECTPTRGIGGAREGKSPKRFTMGLRCILECWIVGDPLTERFLVEVNSDKRIKDLRQAIKQERDDALGNVKAMYIMLWKACRLLNVAISTLPTSTGFHTGQVGSLAREEYSRGNKSSLSTCRHREIVKRLSYNT